MRGRSRFSVARYRRARLVRLERRVEILEAERRRLERLLALSLRVAVGGTDTKALALLGVLRGVPTDIPGKQACGLDAVLDAFAELLVMPDPGAIEIALAGIVANYAPGDARVAAARRPAGMREVGDRHRDDRGAGRVGAVEPDPADAAVGVRAQGEGQRPPRRCCCRSARSGSSRSRT